MKIQPPDDDVRLQRLNRPQSEQGAETRAVQESDPVKPSPEVEENREREPRTNADRRKGERRKREEKVLLDTRSGRERRGEGRRQVDRERQRELEAGQAPSQGIDIKA